MERSHYFLSPNSLHASNTRNGILKKRRIVGDKTQIELPESDALLRLPAGAKRRDR
jgi:hypothetical protein